MKENLEKYLESIKSTKPTIASIMSRDMFFDCINKLYGTHIFSKEELANEKLFHIYYYSIPEGKKEFNIATVRQAIIDISLQPLEGKNFFVFEDFDTAGLPAQNAALKLLEDCPDYAVIFLLVNNPKNLIGTIESRTISFFDDNYIAEISEEAGELLNQFFQGNKTPWIGYMYKNEFSKEEVFSILTKVFGYLDYEKQKSCKEVLIALEKINERPKNLLEKFFLGEDFF